MAAEATIPTGGYHDRLGTLRLVTPAPGWTGYVLLAVDELHIAGAGTDKSPAGDVRPWRTSSRWLPHRPSLNSTASSNC